MQLRALIKTRRRKWAVIALGVVVCAAAVWLLLDAGHKPTDEEKYRELVQLRIRMRNLVPFAATNKLRGPLRSSVEWLDEKTSARCYQLHDELVASGYLVTFAITNDNADTLALRDQLGTNSYWAFSQARGVMIITCRTNDVARFRAALEKQP